ncbi:Pogo transposable element-like 36 [Homarus americanus]|uniref:Pogo transposable element-like 36 n=1 Tax=Homarus americanus TaxID=6706 RepID=A0A8J5MPR4_HOMAM|nr:Pogo transposable element-like 36 [Homarus americanus]
MAPIVKHRRYEACFKLKVIAYAQSHNNCAASREYGVTEKMVRDWRSKEHLLRSMPRNKCAMRRGAAHWPILEKHAVDMVHEQRQNGYIVSRNMICIWALKWAKQNQEHSKDFKATASWCSRFMERSNLVLRQKTKIAQKLPADLNCGNMRAPELDVLCDFVIKAWNDINVETVIKSFKKCGISNSMDGMEDDMLWEDEDETEAEATSSDLEFDPYDDAAIDVSQDVLEELMISHVDDVDFEGF